MSPPSLMPSFPFYHYFCQLIKREDAKKRDAERERRDDDGDGGRWYRHGCLPSLIDDNARTDEMNIHDDEYDDRIMFYFLMPLPCARSMKAAQQNTARAILVSRLQARRPSSLLFHAMIPFVPSFPSGFAFSRFSFSALLSLTLFHDAILLRERERRAFRYFCALCSMLCFLKGACFWDTDPDEWMIILSFKHRQEAFLLPCFFF